MRFIHAADIHLGTTFKGLKTTLDSITSQKISEALDIAFDRLIDFALKKDVDFILMPGDLFNTNDYDPYIQTKLLTAFEQLKEKNISVYVSFGNHDFNAKQYRLLWPDNVYVFDEVTTYQQETKDHQQVKITGFSYQDMSEKRDVLADFPMNENDNSYYIGMYHGSISGNQNDRYAGTSISELNKKNYDYWALGHIHKRQVLQEKPFIAYSGCLQGLNRTEIDEKGFYYVEDGKVDFVAVAPVVWRESDVLKDFGDEYTLLSYIINKPTEAELQSYQAGLLEYELEKNLTNTKIVHVDFKDADNAKFAAFDLDQAGIVKLIDETVNADALISLLANNVNLELKKDLLADENILAIKKQIQTEIGVLDDH